MWLPAWPQERLAATREELNGRALLLYEQSHGGLRVVAYAPAAASRAAIERAGNKGARNLSKSKTPDPFISISGIRPGMPLAEAVALHEYAATIEKPPGKRGRSPFAPGTAQNRDSPRRFSNGPQPPLHIEAHDPVADRLALERLAQDMAAFSPLVSLEDAPRPESLLLDITGLAALFGGERRLARQVAQALVARGLTARVAIADTRGAAWGLAHHDPTDAAPISPPGDARLALAPLPLAALRLSPATIETLGELGVRRIGSLLHLPRGAVASRFGPETLRRLDEALGAATDVAPAEQPDEPLVAERLFEFPTDRRELVEATLAQLLHELVAPLVRERKGFLRLACRLGRVGLAAVEFEVGLFRPTAAPGHVLELMCLRLDALALRLARETPVESARITVTAAAPLRLEQQGLFAEAREQASPRKLAALVDRLASRLGRQAVVRPTPLADVQPEYACQYLPLDAEVSMRGAGRDHSSPLRPRTNRQRRSRSRARGQPSRQKSPSDVSTRDDSNPLGAPNLLETTAETPEVADTVFRRSAFLPGERPLRLLATPAPLEAMSIAPEGPPACFEFDGQSERIAQVWGPERIETGWWRGRCLRRDYYRVETATGSRFWLFRRLADGRWFLHGEFE